MTTSGGTPRAQASRVNPFAVAAFACGIVQFGDLFYKGIVLIGIAAIILGHIAVRQIRRTGDRGYGLAKTGLILGYGVWVMSLLAAFVGLVMASGTPVSPSP